MRPIVRQHIHRERRRALVDVVIIVDRAGTRDGLHGQIERSVRCQGRRTVILQLVRQRDRSQETCRRCVINSHAIIRDNCRAVIGTIAA